jgi:hypothetical protein
VKRKFSNVNNLDCQDAVLRVCGEEVQSYFSFVQIWMLQYEVQLVSFLSSFWFLLGFVNDTSQNNELCGIKIHQMRLTPTTHRRLFRCF